MSISEIDKALTRIYKMNEGEIAESAFRDSCDYGRIQDCKRREREIANSTFRDSFDADLVRDYEERERQLANS